MLNDEILKTYNYLIKNKYNKEFIRVQKIFKKSYKKKELSIDDEIKIIVEIYLNII